MPVVDSLTIRLEGRDAKKISVGAFAKALSGSLAILRELDAGRTLIWKVARVSSESPIEVEYVAEAKRDDHSSHVARRTIEFLRRLDSGLRPIDVSRDALLSAKALVDILNNSVGRITFLSPDTEPFSPSRSVQDTVDKILMAVSNCYGTIEGNLETVSVHGANKFHIYDTLAPGRKIECIIPDDDIENASALLARRVSVSGKITYQGDRAKSIRVDHFEAMPSPDTLPTFADVRGMIESDDDPVECLRRAKHGL